MKAVIAAGGKGIRLSSVLQNLPKPMVQIDNKPVLEHQILNLVHYGITEIVIVIGHKGSAIRDYFGNGEKVGASVTYFEEDHPLGTAGALYYLKDILREDFVLVYGDLMFDINWNRFIESHSGSNASVTVFAHPNDHPEDSDVLIADNGVIKRILPKNSARTGYTANLVSAGLYCISPGFLNNMSEEYCDLERDLIRRYLSSDSIHVYRSTEYVKDIGTPERLERAREDYKNGIISAKNYSNKQKAIFLDRDGTINVHRGYVRKESDFELIDRVPEAIRSINLSKYLAIVVTNQPVIARGETTIEELENIHAKLQYEIGKKGAYIDDLFYCPHHPDKGFKGERVQFKIACKCRKPNIGMITEAVNKYNIDTENSWIIGDTMTDVKTGKNSGLKTVLIRNTPDASETAAEKPDHIAHDLFDAVQLILKPEQSEGER